MELDRRDAAAVELAGQRLRAVLGPGEDDRATGRAGRSTSTGTRARGPRSTWWSMVATGDCAGVGLMRDRVAEEPLDQHVDRLVRVAEKSSRWLSRGSVEQPAHGRREPGSAMGRPRRAGDLDGAEVAVPPGRWSSSRPGQASTMSTPRRRPWTCGFWPTPPKTVRVLRPAASARGRRTPRSGRPAHGSAPGPGHAVGAAADDRPGRRAGSPAGAGRRRSCRSRCGPGPGRRDPRGSREGWPPGSAWAGDAARGEHRGEVRGRRGRRTGRNREVGAGRTAEDKVWSLTVGVSRQKGSPEQGEASRGTGRMSRGKTERAGAHSTGTRRSSIASRGSRHHPVEIQPVRPS